VGGGKHPTSGLARRLLGRLLAHLDLQTLRDCRRSLDEALLLGEQRDPRLLGERDDGPEDARVHRVVGDDEHPVVFDGQSASGSQQVTLGDERPTGVVSLGDEPPEPPVQVPEGADALSRDRGGERVLAFDALHRRQQRLVVVLGRGVRASVVLGQLSGRDLDAGATGADPVCESSHCPRPGVPDRRPDRSLADDTAQRVHALSALGCHPLSRPLLDAGHLDAARRNAGGDQPVLQAVRASDGEDQPLPVREGAVVCEALDDRRETAAVDGEFPLAHRWRRSARTGSLMFCQRHSGVYTLPRLAADAFGSQRRNALVDRRRVIGRDRQRRRQPRVRVL